jgi:uncharacterized protein (DUF4213/DUF364 family)
MEIYITLKNFLREQLSRKNLLEDRVEVRGKVLSSEEAIGTPERRDFPLLKGKERLLEADYQGSKGQAFTDSPYSFAGKLRDFLDMPLQNNFEKAAFIAVLNAVMRHFGLIDGTVHCKDQEPNRCAQKLIQYLEEKYGCPRIALIGLQPALLDYISQVFPVRVADLDPESIGKSKYGILIEDAREMTYAVIKWCDLLLVTGSTIANGTINDFLKTEKPVIFYGTTIAGAAKVLGLERFCACAT